MTLADEDDSLMKPGSTTKVNEGAASDQELMRRIVVGEQRALVQLHDRHLLLLRKIVTEMVADAFDTEEILQDVFAIVWRRAASFDARRGEPLGWIIRVARRRALDHLRKTSRRPVCSVRWEPYTTRNPDTDLEPLEWAWSVESQVDSQDLGQQLGRLVEELPATQRDVLRLTYYEELSQRQIVARIGISLGRVKSCLAIAHRRLSERAGHLREDLNSR